MLPSQVALKNRKIMLPFQRTPQPSGTDQKIKFPAEIQEPVANHSGDKYISANPIAPNPLSYLVPQKPYR